MIGNSAKFTAYNYVPIRIFMNTVSAFIFKLYFRYVGTGMYNKRILYACFFIGEYVYRINTRI